MIPDAHVYFRPTWLRISHTLDGAFAIDLQAYAVCLILLDGRSPSPDVGQVVVTGDLWKEICCVCRSRVMGVVLLSTMDRVA